MTSFPLAPACAALIAGLAATGSVTVQAAGGGRIAMHQVEWGGDAFGGIAVIDDADNPTIRRVTNPPPEDEYAVDFAPSWSPDGRQLVFYRRGSGSDVDGIYRVNVDGSNLTRLLAEDFDFFGPPTWGPRSTNLIAFISHSYNPIEHCVSVMSPDGSNRRNLLCPQGWDGTPREIQRLQWFPDGRHLLVCTGRSGNPYNVRKVNVATGNAPLLASFDRCPARIDISPDGKQLVLEHDEAIHIVDVTTRASRFLTAGRSPVFSADGQKVAFQKEATTAFYPLFVIDTDGNNAQQITPPPPPGIVYSTYGPIEWSVDGSQVLVSSTIGGEDDDFYSHAYQIIRLDDGYARALTTARSNLIAYPNPWFEAEDAAIALSNGLTRRNLIGRQTEEKLYKIVVPTGVSSLQINTSHGTGDVSLYASLSEAPSPDDAQHWSTHGGTNNEAIGISPAAAGVYYIKVVGEQAFGGVNLRATHTP